jgi:adenylate cyclase
MPPDDPLPLYQSDPVVHAQEDNVFHRFSATLAADVVGYSRLMELDETGTVRRFRRLRSTVLDVLFKQHGGIVISTAGDGLIVLFDQVEPAVACAFSVQETLAQWEPQVDEGQRMQLRVGINASDLLHDGNAVHGDGINVAARIQALAEPGGILVSDEVHRHLGTDQASRFSAQGPQPLKNIGRLVSVWHWHPAGKACSAATSVTAAGPTVAVLPFDNLSQEPRWNSFCDGLVEDLITDLSRYPDVLVIARQSSSAYKGRSLDVRDIGRALGARYVLEGSVQANAGRLKVTAQLIDATSGAHVWADRYVREETDLFAIQSEIVSHVIAALAGFGGSILRVELAVARRKPPASLKAYEMYLLGYEQEARLDREGILKSIELLEAAVRVDPHFSRSWTVLGWAYGLAAQNGWVDDVADARRRRAEAVQQAAKLDPTDSLALAQLVLLRGRGGDLIGACEAFDRALILGANHPDTIAFLAPYLSAVADRPREALDLMQHAFSLNPHAPTWYDICYMRVAYFGSLFETALASTARAPAMLSQKLFRVLAHAQLGHKTEMVAAVHDLLIADPDLLIVKTEMAGLCPAALELFRDGVAKAELVSMQYRRLNSHTDTGSAVQSAGL